MKKDATNGMVLVIIGFCCAILAIVVRINIQTADRYHRMDAERDFAAVQSQLEVIKANQEFIKKRQAVAMRKLGIDLVDPGPTTRS